MLFYLTAGDFDNGTVMLEMGVIRFVNASNAFLTNHRTSAYCVSSFISPLNSSHFYYRLIFCYFLIVIRSFTRAELSISILYVYFRHFSFFSFRSAYLKSSIENNGKGLKIHICENKRWNKL